MGKKCSFNKHIKKMIAFVLVCLIAITLTGCDSSNRRGEGSLNMSDTYASVGNYSITVEELYDSLRYSANDYLENAVIEFLYAKEIEELKADLAKESPKYAEKLTETILTEVYGTSEEKDIEALSEKEKSVKINTYVDNMALKGYKISTADVEAGTFTTVYPNYYLEVAKYIAAEKHLTEEFTVENGVINFGEINDESYFTTDEVVHWYEDNYKNKGDVTAVLVRFMSSTEANAVLKAFGIKTYDGAWYQIPLNADEVKTKTDYEEYYDEYVVDPTDPDKDNSSIEVLGNGKVTILKIFIEIYNYIYGGFRDQITDEFKAEGSDAVLTTNYNDYVAANNHPSHLNYYYYIQNLIKNDKVSDDYTEEDYANDFNALKTLLINYDNALKETNEELETIVMSHDRINGYNSSLATYVYNTLKTEASEEGKTFTQYSTSAKAYGDYYYLVFKLDQEADEELYKENESEESDEHKHDVEFTNPTLLNTILNEMFEAEITETYIHEVEHERIEEAELKIYDSVIELVFTQSDSELVGHYHKTKKSNNNAIAQVKYQGETKEIKVDDLYAYLEPLYGPQQAMALLFNKFIKDTDYYKDLEGNYDDYVVMLENMLSYFANDYYASYGYPSSIGKYNFMLLYYRTADVDKAIYDYLMVSDAQSAFYQDILDKFESNDTFFQNVLDFGNGVYDKFFSLTATGLNVYVDKDEDGVHDELAEDDPLRQEAVKLMQEAIAYIETSVEDYATAVTNLVAEYKAANRVEEDNPTEASSRWWKYRKAGLYLESTSVGEVTNSSTDSEIKERVELLYSQLKADKVLTENGLSTVVLDTLNLDNDDSTNDYLISNENGYTLLLITAGANPASAKFEDEELLDSYLSVPVILNDKKETVTLEYTSDKATLAQTKVYVLEYLLLGDVYSLPEATTTALDTFILPLIERYTSAASQYNQILKAMGEITFASTSAVTIGNDAFKEGYTRKDFLNSYVDIQERVADSYDTDLYPNWWTVMYE